MRVANQNSFFYSVGRAAYNAQDDVGTGIANAYEATAQACVDVVAGYNDARATPVVRHVEGTLLRAAK